LTVKKGDAKMDLMNQYVKDISKTPTYIYKVDFEKPIGIVMPIIVELTYADDSKERKNFPTQICMKDDTSLKKSIYFQKRD
jgi:hypothetical protein